MMDFFKTIVLGFKIILVLFALMFVLAFLDVGYEYKTCKSLIDISTFEQPRKCKGYWSRVAELKEQSNRYNPNRTMIAKDRSKGHTHKVKEGETLSGISKRYHIQLSELIRRNGGRTTIFVNQVIRIQ